MTDEEAQYFERAIETAEITERYLYWIALLLLRIAKQVEK